MSELIVLRERAQRAERALFEREVAEAKARTERLEREQKEADERAAEEAKAAREARLEEMRRGAWVNHRINSLVASGQGDRPLSLTEMDKFVADGWPPNVGPENFPDLILPVSTTISDDPAASTPMGKMLAAVLEKRERLARVS